MPSLFLALLIALTGCDGGPEPGVDCEALATGAEADACWVERAESLYKTEARGALDAARRISNPGTRDLVLFRVLTESAAFRDDELRAICEAELSSAAHKDQCRRYLERPHLRVEAPGAPGGEAQAPRVGSAADCAEGGSPDYCAYSKALEMRGASIDEVREVLAGIESADVRGQAVAGVLRQRKGVSTIEELRALGGLLELTEPGRWRAESASLLGAELPFQVLQACGQKSPPETCAALERDELLPFALSTCAGAGELEHQCFDHICMNATEGALNQGMRDGPAALATRVKERYAALVAVDSRIDALSSCHAVWLGRKLVQRGQQDVGWAAERCGALGGEEADACYSGLSEELLTRWLRGNDVADHDALVELVTKNPSAVGALPEPVPEFLPCGALSVLTGQLAPSLSGQRPSPQVVKTLAEAAPRCVWGAEP